jgi:hypothetical protein
MILDIARRKRRLLAAVQQDIPRLWSEIIITFSKAKRVYVGRIGPTAKMPFEYELLSLIAAQGKVAETFLMQGLKSDNPQIVAYCLLGLHLMGSNGYRDFRAELCARPEEITWQAGSFAVCEPLGHFIEARFFKGTIRAE